MIPIMKSPDSIFMLWQTRVKSEVDPVLTNELLAGSLLKGIVLINGVTILNHKLGRKPKGWILTDIDAAATVYRSAAFSTTTLTLTSNAAATAAIWVF